MVLLDLAASSPEQTEGERKGDPQGQGPGDARTVGSPFGHRNNLRCVHSVVMSVTATSGNNTGMSKLEAVRYELVDGSILSLKKSVTTAAMTELSAAIPNSERVLGYRLPLSLRRVRAAGRGYR